MHSALLLLHPAGKHHDENPTSRWDEQMSGRRLRLTDNQRRHLAVKGKALGRKLLGDVARLCALIPPPYFNLVRYFGPLSSASPLRPYAVRSPTEPTPQRPTAPVRPRRMKRADLLARVFGFKVLAWPCGGHLRPTAVITKPDVIQAILAAVVLSNATSARAPPHQPIRVN